MTGVWSGAGRWWWRAVLAGWVFAVVPAVAAPPAKKDAKGKPKSNEPTADDFLGDFGASATKGSDDLKNAVSGMKQQQAAVPENLGPRAEVHERDAAVHLKHAFINSKIMLAGQGCVGGPAAGSKVMSMEAPDLPFKLQPFAVCAKLESKRGRSTPITFKVVTPKGRLVAQSEEIIDFGSKSAVDVVVDYPELPFPVAGVYQYRMEVEGVLVTQVPILEIKSKAQDADIPSD